MGFTGSDHPMEGLGVPNAQTLPVRLARDVCTFEARFGAGKRLSLVGKRPC